jgi:hypothetical protein
MTAELERKVTLEDWLKSISHDGDKGVLTAVKAHHWIQTPSGFSKGEEIAGCAFHPDKTWSPKEVAALIRGKCQTFSQELPGTQTFRLYAYFGQDEAGAHHHISCAGRTSMEGGLTEPPDARGMNSAGMRWGEIVVSRAFGMQTETWNMTKFLLTELKEDRDYWAKEARDGHTIVMQLVREKMEDNHKQKMAELLFQRTTAERAKLIGMLPAFIRFFTKNQNIIPEGMADTAILETAAQWIRKLPKEEQVKAMSAFPQELMIIVGDRLLEISSRQEKEEEQLVLLSKAKTAEDAASDRSLAESILERAMGLGANGAKPALSA